MGGCGGRVESSRVESAALIASCIETPLLAAPPHGLPCRGACGSLRHAPTARRDERAQP